MSVNSKFAENSEYIFYLQYLKEFKEVMSSAQISLRKCPQATVSQMTVGQLTTSSSLWQIFNRNEGYKFLKKVRGSAPYWEKTMKDLCAMVRQLGIPTWLYSLSAADRRWPEFVRAILTLQGKEVPPEIDWNTHFTKSLIAIQLLLL